MNNLRYPQLFLHELNNFKANVSFHNISTLVAGILLYPVLQLNALTLFLKKPMKSWLSYGNSVIGFWESF